MGIFTGKEKRVDMSIDASREQFMDKVIKNQETEAPIETEIVSGVTVQKQEQPRRSILSGSRDSEMVITLSIKTNKKELLMHILDGVAEITDQFGSETIYDFKVERK